MRNVTLIILVFLTLSGHANAAKRDFRGIVLGMTVEEAFQAARAGGAKCGVVPIDDFACSWDHNTFARFKLNNNRPRRIFSLDISFKGNFSREGFRREVINEYGLVQDGQNNLAMPSGERVTAGVLMLGSAGLSITDTRLLRPDPVSPSPMPKF